MANKDFPNGFTPYPRVIRQQTFFDNTPANDIEIGDLCVRGTDGEISRLTDVAAGNGVKGVALNRQSSGVAGDLTLCLVGGHGPDAQQFSAQDDGVGSTPANHRTYLEEECDIVVGAPDTDRGHSIMEIDISSHAGSAKVARLVDILDTGEAGYSKLAANARWIVTLKAQATV